MSMDGTRGSRCRLEKKYYFKINVGVNGCNIKYEGISLLFEFKLVVRVYICTTGFRIVPYSRLD